MGTVRYTSTSSPATGGSSLGKKGGKRKASSSSASKTTRRAFVGAGGGVDPDDLSVAHALAQDMLDERLASRDKWQVCTQRNLSLIRTECMNVRRELGRVEETVDTVQMQVEDGLAQYEHRHREIQQFIGQQREQMQVFLEKMGVMETHTTEHKEATQRYLTKMNKRLEGFAEKQKTATDGLVDEEMLLTQLAGLQERQEVEIAAFKSELEDQFEQKLKTMAEDMARKMAALEQSLMRQKRDEHEHEQHTKSDTDGLRGDVQALLRRFNDLEHTCDRLRTDNNELRAALAESRQQCGSMDDQLVQLSREMERMGHALRSMPPPPSQHHFSPPLPPHPPPPLPSPVNLGPLEQKLHFVAKDVRLMAEDYSRWKNHADTNHHGLRQEMVARISDLEDSLFKALNHDSGQHKFENHRLKDACFDMRADLMDVRKELVRLRDRVDQDIRRLEQARANDRRFSSPPRRYNRDRALSSGSNEYSHDPGAREAFHRRAAEVEQIYFGTDSREPRGRSASPPNRRQSTPVPRRRSRSRSRSRSRGRHETKGNQPPLSSSEMLYRPLNRPGAFERPPSPNAHRSPARDPTTPQRAPRNRSRSHEVIVIEDGDEDGEIGADEDMAEPGEASTQNLQSQPPYMAPPDPVLDEADESASTLREVVEESTAHAPTVAPASPAAEVPEQSVARDASVADLHTGALLYACFCGAPTLDLEWAKFFAPLRQSDVVDATEMLQFQARYPAIATYPSLLSEFVVKASQVQTEVHVPGGGSDSSTVTSLSTVDATSVFTEFSKIVVTLHQDWANRVIELLSNALQQHHASREVSSSLRVISSPPTLTPNAEVEVYSAFLRDHWAWAQTQARSISPLVREDVQQARGRDLSSVWTAIDILEPSPGVLVFLWMFTVIDAEADQALNARFRLNGRGRELLGRLWEHAINKLPPALFVECSWLDDQSSARKTIPVLGVVHVLTVVLLWFSPQAQLLSRDKQNETITQSVHLLMDSVRIGGKRLVNLDGGSTGPLVVLGDESQSFEMEFTTAEWPQLLNLECFALVVKELTKS